MSKSLLIVAVQPKSRKSIISLGLMEMFKRHFPKVAYFRPLIYKPREPNGIDREINLISSYHNIDLPYEDMYGLWEREADELITQGKQDDLYEKILTKYKKLEEEFDFVLCEGTDYGGSTASFEFDINADIATNLSLPVLIVQNGHQQSVNKIKLSLEVAIEQFDERNCTVVAVIINRVKQKMMKEVQDVISSELKERNIPVYVIKEDTTLTNPTIRDVERSLDAELLSGGDFTNKQVHHYLIADMGINKLSQNLQPGSLVIMQSHRSDTFAHTLALAMAPNLPNAAGILLTGSEPVNPIIINMIEGIPDIPVLKVQKDTYQTATELSKIHMAVHPESQEQISRIIDAFESHVDVPDLEDRIVKSETHTVTPKMFEYGLLQTAKQNKKHIVLPEGAEDRILLATEILVRKNIVDITLLGKKKYIEQKIRRLDLNLTGVEIIEPAKSKEYKEFADTYFDLRKHRNINIDMAKDAMAGVNYFGAMMVYKGLADGMVSGCVHSTRNTLRPAFEIIRTRPDTPIISSIFLMCLKDKVLVYGDCAVNPNPNAEQLAQIAVSSANTAKLFGIDPVVAMLSYSTGDSGSGEDVDKVREACKIAQDKCPELSIDGPIQYDAAVDRNVGKLKMPDSKVAGHATVFIFPDLNTGNNTYKAVQRSSGAVAIGPVIQGLNMPVNDLSRGCSVTDIINTIAITSIQSHPSRDIRVQQSKDEKCLAS